MSMSGYPVSRRYASMEGFERDKKRLVDNGFANFDEHTRLFHGDTLVVFIFKDMAEAAFADLVLMPSHFTYDI